MFEAVLLFLVGGLFIAVGQALEFKKSRDWWRAKAKEDLKMAGDAILEVERLRSKLHRAGIAYEAKGNTP